MDSPPLPDPSSLATVNSAPAMDDHSEAIRANLSDKVPGEGDTCRICRSESTEAEPLFYPCKCSGSIKFVHQECLMEWLSHSNKKYCELCKTPFRFTKLYDSHMPHTLPMHIFAKQAALHTLRYLLTWARALVVGLVWLVVLPWCIRWSWRGLFWLLDAGWARDAWLAREENQRYHSTPAPSLADSLQQTLNHSVSTPAHPDTSAEPITLSLSKMLISVLLNPWRPFSIPRDSATFDTASSPTDPASSTLLSDIKSLNQLTASPSLNRFILDVLEGQIVTFLIVIAFILVFLIREWVVQQQPIINAAAQLRDAELQVEVVDQAARRLRARQPHQLQALNVEDPLVADPPAPAPRTPVLAPDADNASDSNADSTTGLAGTTATTDSPLEADWEVSPDGQPQAVVHGANDSEDGAVGPSSRPEMPPRDSSARVNQVLQAMEDESDTSPGTQDARSRDGGSTASGESWQAVEDFGRVEAALVASLEQANRTNSPDHHAEESRHDDNEAASSLPSDGNTYVEDIPREFDASAENTMTRETSREDHEHYGHSNAAENTREETQGGTQEDMRHAASSDPVHSRLEAGGLEQGIPSESTPALPDQEQHDNTAPNTLANDPNHVDLPRGNVVQRVFNWFWADIVPDMDDNPPNTFEEAIIQDEADEPPFVRVPAPEGIEVAGGQPGALPVQDPEVLQAAAEAGLDADALDDVEDLEGILELIGMQGPLVGLLQTAMFCGVLITTTLWAALGAPYLFGKLALLFLGDPLVFLIMAPLRIVSLVADGLVDSTIYIGGLILYLTAQALSQLAAWVMQALSLKVEAKTFDFLAKAAHGALRAAGGRLSKIVAGDGPVETGFLTVSLHAHRSLQILQLETAQTTTTIVGLLATVSDHIKTSTVRQMSFSLAGIVGHELRQAKDYYSWTREYLQDSFATNISNGTFTLTVTRDALPLDPSLAYWSATDRCLTIFAGYLFLAMIGTMYLLRKEPLFTSLGLQRLEKGFTDFLKQAGGVLKVILIISIEMLAFPLYCGCLLDCALLPLFERATIGSRLLFAVRSPWMFAFVHWFIGTCYMFHFALFVSACRRVMRSGVLYFIRDPDDPTFHPVRDVLERNVTTQLRKIAFSALVYGGLVICCLGGVVWGVDYAFSGVFPIRWATPEPLLEFPIDFLMYNLLAPIVSRFVLPSQGVEYVFKLWLKRSARSLRLSQFLFGDRQKDEEGHYARITNSESSSDNVEFVQDGRYVRAPASDQVRIPKGDRVFLEVTEDNKRLDGQIDSRTGPHGRKNRNFAKVYVPPWFRVRIGLFIFSLWLFAAATGLGITVLPMAFGRVLLALLMPEHVDFNDLYAFSSGLITLGGALCLVLRSRGDYENARNNVYGLNIAALLSGARINVLRMLRSVYVYGFALIVVPTLFALVLQLYLILPLHTYTATWSAGSGEASEDFTSTMNATTSAMPTPALFSGSPVLAGHTVHVLQDWTLGFLYGRVVLRLLLLSRNSRPATALRLITRDGYTNPNAKLATRAFIAPTLLLFAVILLCPPVFGMAVNHILRAFNSPADALPQTVRVKVYRYSYPVCASQVIVLWCVWEVFKATQRWRTKIKDEVYLVGERLHNFGEKRPPAGSRGAVRRER